MNVHVHSAYPLDEGALAHLCPQLDPKVQLTVGNDLPTPADYQILIASRPQREQLTASPNLRALIIPSSGLPAAVQELMHDFPDIAVHNLHHNATSVAEMAITLLLAAAKSIVPMDRMLRAHDWSPRYRGTNSLTLEGKTALILGYGAIGRRVARGCRGLGMKVMAIRRNVGKSPPDAPDEIHPPQALHRVLPRANALIICLPLTHTTNGLIGEAELALLSCDAVLVNVGRGPVVDEAALFCALRDGKLHSAGLDVWYNYPSDEVARSHTPASAFPFHELDNVVMSPHRAGHSTERLRRRMTHLARLLNTAARGEPMPNRVDVRAGY